MEKLIYAIILKNLETIIKLTQSEKRTFLGFLAILLGGSFILMLLIALLYYKNEKSLYYDLIITKMRNESSNISSQIIMTHMNGQTLDLKKFLNNKNFKISFYDKYKNKIIGNMNDEVDFSKEIIKKRENFILIEDSTYGHLGIYYIAIEENIFFNNLRELKLNIILLFVIIYSIVSLIAFYLAKLFLKPIKDEREKLNNFIKDTTHELNTPISAILMSSEKEELTKKQTQRIKLAAQRISEIYKDLIYIFLEDSEENFNIQNYNLKLLIKEQLKYFEVLADKKKLAISINLNDFYYDIDENDFIRLFNNVVSNAIKYNKQKGNIVISLSKNTLTIKDTGIGIQQDKINDIFNRYIRATTQNGGFGIGLDIVSNICKKYSIKYEIKSKLNEGSTFKFIF